MDQIAMTYDGRTVGTAAFCRDGLYCAVDCRCEAVSDAVLRAFARADGRWIALGVLIPENGELQLRRRLPLTQLPAENVEAVTVTDAAAPPSAADEAAEPSPSAGPEEQAGERTEAADEPAAGDCAAPPSADDVSWQPWTGSIGGVLVEDGRVGEMDGRTVVAIPFEPDRPLPHPDLLRRCQTLEMDGRTWLALADES